MKRLVGIFLVISVLQATAGGGWTSKKKSGYFKLGQNFIYSGRFFNPDGDVIDITTVGYYSTSLYAEYGLTDNFTVTAYVPFFVRSTLHEVEFRQSGATIPGDFVNAFGDVDLMFKYGFFQKSAFPVAVELLLGIPSGETQGGEGGILQTGDGEFNQMISVYVSHSFYPAPFYITAGGGFNNRTNDFSDEYRAAFEFGFVPIDRLSFILKLNTVQSLFNGNAENGGSNGIFANNTEYVSYTPEINYQFSDKLGVSVNAGFAFSGRNILASPNYGVGLFSKF